uniref:Uncharacterized protein n=1 Tax=Arundo donax TaxID=35708 RepID=A0A0A9E4R2_ARUDO
MKMKRVLKLHKELMQVTTSIFSQWQLVP